HPRASHPTIPRSVPLTSLPTRRSSDLTEMMDAFEEPVERIMEAIHSVLERTPPELVADISTNGIVMTGGGSLVSGFGELATARTDRESTRLNSSTVSGSCASVCLEDDR